MSHTRATIPKSSDEYGPSSCAPSASRGTQICIQLLGSDAGEEVPALRRGKDASAEQPVGEREADVEEGAPPRAGLVDAKQADEQRDARLRGEER